MSSLAARRAGKTAAPTPASAAMITTSTSWPGAIANLVKPSSSDGTHDGPAEEQADPEAEERAEQRDDHRLPTHRGPDLAAAHADRAEQPELAGALVDRQRQGVRDADQRDEHREEQQRVEEVHDVLIAASWVCLVLGVVAQFGGRVRRDDLARSRRALPRADARLSLARTRKSSCCDDRKFASKDSSEITKSPKTPSSEPS